MKDTCTVPTPVKGTTVGNSGVAPPAPPEKVNGAVTLIAAELKNSGGITNVTLLNCKPNRFAGKVIPFRMKLPDRSPELLTQLRFALVHGPPERPQKDNPNPPLRETILAEKFEPVRVTGATLRGGVSSISVALPLTMVIGSARTDVTAARPKVMTARSCTVNREEDRTVSILTLLDSR